MCKRYDGKISENVKKILTEATSADVGIKTKKKVTVDETAINYDATADLSDGECEYPPAIGLSLENVDLSAGTFDVSLSTDSDIASLDFNIDEPKNG